MQLHQSCEMASAFLWQSPSYFPHYYWITLRCVSKCFQTKVFNVSIQALVKKTLPIADLSGITGNPLALQKSVFLPLDKKFCKKYISATTSALEHNLFCARKCCFLQIVCFKGKEELLYSHQILSTEIALVWYFIFYEYDILNGKIMWIFV